MTPWPVARIRDIATVFDGPHATPRSTKTAVSGPIFLSISSLQNGRLDLARSAFLSEADFRVWTRRVTPRPDDVVFAYETRLGEAAIIPRSLKCALGRRLALIRPNTVRIEPRFTLFLSRPRISRGNPAQHGPRLYRRSDYAARLSRLSSRPAAYGRAAWDCGNAGGAGRQDRVQPPSTGLLIRID